LWQIAARNEQNVNESGGSDFLDFAAVEVPVIRSVVRKAFPFDSKQDYCAIFDPLGSFYTNVPQYLISKVAGL